MLERASSSAECTAHQILRRLERPTRSRRTLDPGFWRHGGDQLDYPVWWPIYLSNVRRKAQTYSVFPDGTNTNGLSSLNAGAELEHGALRKPRLGRYRQAVIVNNNTRSFTQFAAPAQQPSTTSIKPENQFGGQNFINDSQTRDVGNSEEEASTSFQPFDFEAPRRPFSQPPDPADNIFLNLETENVDVPSQPAPEPAVADSRPDYERVWLLFAESEYKADSASHLLRFLAKSDDRVDMKRALKALSFIPEPSRSKDDYEAAMQVMMQLHQYKSATNLVREAISKQMGDNLFFKFMAYCVGNTLWNSLAVLWDTAKASGEDMRKLLLRARHKEGAVAQSPSFAGHYSFHFDEIEDLPSKIVTLADRLARSDAVLAAQKETLLEICEKLAETAIGSEKVMNVITGEGVIALFEVQQRLHFKTKLHTSAIATINRMQNKGSKSQLALLIYRNLRFMLSETKTPQWVYGSLLRICADGRQRPDTYNFILDEFTTMHGRPDDSAFRAAISACASQGESSALFKIFDEFCRVSGHSRSSGDLNSLIYVYAVIGDAENAQIQFDRLQSEFGFSPDIISWTSLILAYARSQNEEASFDVFDDMKKAGVKPNAHTWSILMSVASRRGDIDKVQTLYKEAKEDKLPDSTYMLGALVESLLLNDEYQKAEALVLRGTRLLTTESPTRLWNILLRYWAFKTDNKAILRLQQLMNLSNVKADGMTYAALMTSLVAQKRTSDALKILRTLHFSRDITPTEFHYSILIHGFAMEKNRDLVVLLYHEMQERFPHATPSARLAMLYMQLQRDRDSTDVTPKSRLLYSPRERQAFAQQSAWHALDHLGDFLHKQTPTELSSNSPNPGFARSSSRKGVESIYFETLIEFLQSNNAFELADQISAQSSKIISPNSQETSISMKSLTIQMQSAIQKRQWTLVDEIWNRVMTIGIKRGSPLTKVESLAVAPAEGINMPSSDGQTFKSMITETLVDDMYRDQSATQILPVRRFMLSRPLSLYIQSLDYQNLHHKIINVVGRITEIGFALSSINWNSYVQALSKSEVWEHRLTAFITFENTLLPNTPPWRLLRRGKLISPADTASGLVQSRSKLDKIDPSIPRPSYFTMIHLSTVLIRAHTSASMGDPSQLDALRKRAPGTVLRVQRTPRVRDRIQGLLLRGRRLIGDKTPRPRASQRTLDQAGVTGSKSPMDTLSPEIANKIKDAVAPSDNLRSLLRRRHGKDGESSDHKPVTVRQRLSRHLEKVEQGEEKITGAAQYIPSLDRFETREEAKLRYFNQRYAKLQHLIELGEQISGEIIKEPIFLAAQARMENERERESRIEQSMLEKLDLVEQIRRDMSSKRLIRDSYRGEPPIDVPLPGATYALPTASKPRGFAEDLLYGDQEELPRDNTEERATTDTQPFQPFELPKRSDPPETIAMREWASTRSYPAVDTRTFRRPIVPPSIRRDKNVPVRYVTERQRRAWSLNKATRRSRLKETQSFVRWNQKAQAKQEERSREIEAAFEAARAKEQEKKDNSSLAARLAMSRGARM